MEGWLKNALDSAFFNLDLCRSVTNPKTTNPIMGFVVLRSAELEIRRAFLSVKRFGMEVIYGNISFRNYGSGEYRRKIL